MTKPATIVFYKTPGMKNRRYWFAKVFNSYEEALKEAEKLAEKGHWNEKVTDIEIKECDIHVHGK